MNISSFPSLLQLTKIEFQLLTYEPLGMEAV